MVITSQCFQSPFHGKGPSFTWFFVTSKKDTSSMSEFGRKFQTICDQLSSIGHPVEENDKLHWFLYGFGSAFESFSTPSFKTFCQVLKVMRNSWPPYTHPLPPCLLPLLLAPLPHQTEEHLLLEDVVMVNSHAVAFLVVEAEDRVLPIADFVRLMSTMHLPSLISQPMRKTVPVPLVMQIYLMLFSPNAILLHMISMWILVHLPTW